MTSGAGPDEPSILAATRRYERWMAARIELVEADLAAKHELMATSPFVLLRGTFYRFAELWQQLEGAALDAPVVLAVGDLHIENFGTWRDDEGRLVWGINDVDEAHPLPYTIDLVRLATSARLAIAESHLSLSPRLACQAILEGYRASLDAGGSPLVLEENDRWLRRIALSRLRAPRRFWRRIDALPVATGALPASALGVLDGAMPRCDPPYQVRRRRAGVGSLGRVRLVAVGDHMGARVAREVKALLPSACVLVESSRVRTRSDYLPILGRAVRDPDPTVGVVEGWIVRRLGPDCSRVELADLPTSVDEERLLRAMGWETANVHLGSRGAADEVRADLDARPATWLREASRVMARATVRDWHEWRDSRAAWPPVPAQPASQA